jgi:hypothetical protein
VVRTCRSFGHDSVRDFMLSLAQDTAVSGSHLHQSAREDDNARQVSGKIIQAAVASLSELGRRLDLELIADERIVAMAAPGQIAKDVLLQWQDATDVFDCTGQVIAPSFVDVHTHDDAAVLQAPEMLSKLSQVVTTVVVGNCGGSPVHLQSSESPVISVSGHQGLRPGD